MASRHLSLETYLSLSTGAARLPPPRPVAYIHQEKRGNKVGVAFLQEGIDASKTVAYREALWAAIQESGNGQCWPLWTLATS